MENGLLIDMTSYPLRTRWVMDDVIVADTTQALLLKEGGYKPILYVPIVDVNKDVLIPNTRTSNCPHKGEACYWDYQDQGKTVADVAWAYLTPISSAALIKDHMAFYEHLFDWVCTQYR